MIRRVFILLIKIIIENNPYMFVKELEKYIKKGYDVVYKDGMEIINPKQAGRPAKQQGMH
jgi:hypothetical protein